MYFQLSIQKSSQRFKVISFPAHVPVYLHTLTIGFVEHDTDTFTRKASLLSARKRPDKDSYLIPQSLLPHLQAELAVPFHNLQCRAIFQQVGMYLNRSADLRKHFFQFTFGFGRKFSLHQ